jgi:hypothetical protein
MKQYLIVGGDGKEYGPVPEPEVRHWIQQGRADGNTRIKETTAADWSRLRDLEEFEPNLAPSAESTSPPNINTPPLPNGPAPQIPQPTAFSPPPTADDLMAELEGRTPSFSIGDCFSIGWRVTMDNFGLALLSFIVFMLISIAAAFTGVGGLIVSGPLLGALYCIYIKRLRNEPAELNNLFDGFKIAFIPLFLVYLLSTLICLTSMIPGGIGAGVALFAGILESAQSGGQPPFDMVVLFLVSGLLMLLPAMVLYSMLVFTFPLALDRRMDAVEALKATWRITKKCWFNCSLLMLCAVLINIVGVLALCLGWLISMPLSFAMSAVAYEQLFGRGVQR